MCSKTELIELTKDYFNNLDKTSILQQAIDVINNSLKSSAKDGFRVIVVDLEELSSKYLLDIHLNDFRRLSVYYRLQRFTVNYKGLSSNAELSISWID